MDFCSRLRPALASLRRQEGWPPGSSIDRPLLRSRFAGCLAIAAWLATAACGGGVRPETTLQVKGSDTMVNVVQAWAEQYRQVRPEVGVEVSGGGSGVGIASLSRGTVDVATASREIKPDEVERIKQGTGLEPVDFVAGYDALAVYVHKDNPLEAVTLAQLEQIYAEGATVTKWTQLGVPMPGRSDEIVRISRQSSSGTYEFFRERALRNRDFKLGSLDMNGSKEVVELVGNTRTAIGYSGMGYATRAVKILGIVPPGGGEAIVPTVETTLGGVYPLARSLHLYTLGEPEGELKRFIDWILSPDGQRIVEENGYVPATGKRDGF
jgi:phosphate transport system substrate-binding protein